MVYPGHAFKPEDLLTFVEMDGFSDDWKDLGLNDEDLMALQISIMLRPKGAPVIPGTSGLRKVRFAPSGWKTGKSGAIRVCYVHFQEYGVVLLVVAYSKDEADDIPAAYKKAYRELIQRENKALSKGVIR